MTAPPRTPPPNPEFAEEDARAERTPLRRGAAGDAPNPPAAGRTDLPDPPDPAPGALSRPPAASPPAPADHVPGPAPVTTGRAPGPPAAAPGGARELPPAAPGSPPEPPTAGHGPVPPPPRRPAARLAPLAAFGAAALILAGVGAVMHVRAPAAESPAAFTYVPRPFLAPAGRPAAAPAQPVAADAALTVPDPADAQAARATAEAFAAALRADDLAAAWARLDPEARADTTEAAWSAEQRLWSGATGAAPPLMVTGLAGYPAYPDRLVARVAGPALDAAALPDTRAPLPPLALDLVRREGVWYVGVPGPLWPDGSPALLRPEDRAGLGWLRYPLRVVPQPGDLTVMARLAALPAFPGSTLSDLIPDDRPLTAATPGYDPLQQPPGARAVWTLPPNAAGPNGRPVTRADVHAYWSGVLKGAGYTVSESPLRLRLAGREPACGCGWGDVEAEPAGLSLDAPIRRQIVHLADAPANDPGGANLLAQRRVLATRGAAADALIAGIPLPPGARLVAGPVDPTSTVVSPSGEIYAVTYAYTFDRGTRTPPELRTFYTGALTGAGWRRGVSAANLSFEAPDGSGRVQIANLEPDPLSSLLIPTTSPSHYTLVFGSRG